MSIFLLRVYCAFLVPAVISTVYLYFYPTWHQCSFPNHNSEKAPFRLLAFGDPQLEGDTSLPGNGHTELFPSIRGIFESIQQNDIGSIGSESLRLLNVDIPNAFRTYHKKLDLWGNDEYLAHIYRTVSRHTNPTHVVVLGDLLGSQWIDDSEFARRSERFWKKVFKGGEKVPAEITDYKDVPASELGEDNRSWKNRIVAVAGNHDIGYAGDIDEDRINRFEDKFGRVNYEVKFTLNTTGKPEVPELRLIVLNSMNLDSPAFHEGLQQDSIDHLNGRLYWEIPQNANTSGSILLTHIPLYKEVGICTDGPFFDHFSKDGHWAGGIKEQNHVSYDVSARILEGIVGPERTRKSIILNGHDHAGCDTYHSRTLIEKPFKAPEPVFQHEDESDEDYYERLANTPPPKVPEPEKWHVEKYGQAAFAMDDPELTGVREITVRSMMGEFGGNAGLLSAWWDSEENEWRYEYSTCAAGVQHIWWAVHVLDVVTLVVGFVAAVPLIVKRLRDRRVERKAKKVRRKKSKGKMVEGKKRQ